MLNADYSKLDKAFQAKYRLKNFDNCSEYKFSLLNYSKYPHTIKSQYLCS